MRFSFDWLKEYLDASCSIRQIAEGLTGIGLEVEEVIDTEEKFKNFKLVKIQTVEKHPSADKLHICSVVDAQGQTLQIVCGAKNVREGLIAVLATPGALIPASHEILKKSKIRGVESQGMMCSYDELDMKVEGAVDGIIDLPEGTPLDAKVGNVLGYEGGILDVSLTPNRGDCFSVKGIARDLAAAGYGSFKVPQSEDYSASFDFPMAIKYDDVDVFYRYAPHMSFVVIKGINNGESPKWIQQRLKNAGLNCISAVVDIANYCMLDCGLPFQIYDADKIKGALNLRFAKRREDFTDFQGKTYQLRQDMLVSTDDSDKPLCLLGIKSGSQIACDEDTKNVLIESALFDPIAISKAGNFLNVTSDSRTRFERGVDRSSNIPAFTRLINLVKNVCGGESSTIFSIGKIEAENRKVRLTKDKLLNVSGCNVEWTKVCEILRKLGLRLVDEDAAGATFLIPSWRYDLNIDVDLIEEVLRICGYSGIKEEPLKIVPNRANALQEDASRVFSLKKLLASKGMSEVVTYSFTSEDFAKAFAENRRLIYIVNAISSDFEVMRPSLLANLLKSAAASFRYGQNSISIFEEGNVFNGECEQQWNLSGLRVGTACSRNWLNRSTSFDVFDIKKDMFSVITACGINENNLQITTEAPSYYHPSRSGSVYVGKKLLGYFGELHPQINKLFKIQERLECFELFSSLLQSYKKRTRAYVEKVFPKICRDFSFLFNDGVSVGGIVSGIYKLDQRIAKVSIFDSFKVNSIQKAIGVAVVIDAVNRTLTEDEAEEISDKVIKYVGEFGGELRG